MSNNPGQSGGAADEEGTNTPVGGSFRHPKIRRVDVPGKFIPPIRSNPAIDSASAGRARTSQRLQPQSQSETESQLQA